MSESPADGLDIARLATTDADFEARLDDLTTKGTSTNGHTDASDWATNCPEYKVTAVEVTVYTQARRAAYEHETADLGASV